MIYLSLLQALAALAALGACILAARSVVRRKRTFSFYLTLSGAAALIVFLAVPGIPPELIPIALLAVVTGALLIPAENQRSTRQLLGDDLEIGDSTAARRLRKQG